MRSTSAWLEDSTSADLLLGTHWLQERVQRKQDGIRQERDSSWASLYQDDGSSLEIISDVYSGRGSPPELQIIETTPLTLSDGKSYVRATVTKECASDLAARYQGLRIAQAGLYSLVSVRKHSVRCTSYGPPAEQLRLVLHTIDWQRGPHSHVVGKPAAVLSLESIKLLMAKLTDTRAQEHQKYHYRESSAMSQSSNAPMEDSQMSEAFASQLPSHSEREPLESRAPKPAPQLLSLLNRPQRGPDREAQRLLNLFNKTRDEDEEVRRAFPPNRIPRGTPGGLDGQVVLHWRDEARRKNLETARHEEIMRPVSRPGMLEQVLLSEQTKHQKSPAYQPQAPKGSRPREESLALPPAQDTTPTFSADLDVDVPTASAASLSGPEWLLGFHFDASSSKIDKPQMSLLNRPDAWQKPPPGHRFVNGSMPIDIYKEIIASLEKDTKSSTEDPDDEGIRVLSDGHDVEPISTQPGTEREDADAEAEPPSSPALSWSSSPEPEPARPAPLRGPELPPDSSFETPKQSPAKDTATRQPSSSLPTLPTRVTLSNETEDSIMGPPSSPPAPVMNTELDEDLDMEVDIPQALGEDRAAALTLPAPTQKTASLTTSGAGLAARPTPQVQVKETPYAKQKSQGATARFGPSFSQVGQTSSGTSKSSSTSIIPATYKDPPSRNLQPTQHATTTPGRQSSSRPITPAFIPEAGLGGKSTKTSPPRSRTPASTGVVASASSSAKIRKSQDVTTPRLATDVGTSVVNGPSRASSVHPTSMTGAPIDETDSRHPPNKTTSNDQGQPKSPSPYLAPTNDFEVSEDYVPSKDFNIFIKREEPDEDTDSIMQDVPLLPSPASVHVPRPIVNHSPSSTHGSASVTEGDRGAQLGASAGLASATSSTKRKSAVSPSRLNSRHPKRRPPIKIGDFGGEPPRQDPVRAIQQEKKEAVERIRKDRESSGRSETPANNNNIRRTTNQAQPEQVPVKPLQTLAVESARSSLQTPVRPNHDVQVPSTQLVSPASPLPERSGSLQAKADPIPHRPRRSEMHTARISDPRMLPPPRSGSENEVPSPPTGSHSYGRGQTEATPLDAPEDTSTTVFERFKAAYPEYTGKVQHFINQCRQMYELDREDKMVQKWLWDDYLIRNRIDYKDYAMQCMEEGEDVLPYLRYYKEFVRDPKFNKGILSDQDVLYQALVESGNRPAGPPPQSSRRSLPWSASARRDSPDVRNPRPSLPNLSGLDGTNETPSHRERPSRSAEQNKRKSTHQSSPGTEVEPPRKYVSRDSIPRSSTGIRRSIESSGNASRESSTGNRHSTGSYVNAYRDYVLGMQKMTSVTGSTKLKQGEGTPKKP